MVTLTENIKNKRKESGLTQRELADLLGISDKTVSRWESGVQVPDAMILPDIARIFHTTVSALYGEETEGSRGESAADQTTAVPKPRLRPVSRWADILFKIITGAGLALCVLFSMLLCNQDSFRGAMAEQNERIRTVLFIILLSVCAVLMINKIWFTFFYHTKDRFHPSYLYDDVRYSSTMMLTVLTIWMAVFPFVHTVPFTEWYAVSVYVAGALFLAAMLWMKRDLRRAGVKVGRAVSIVSVILTAVTILSVILLYVILKANTGYQTMITEETYTAAEGLKEMVSRTTYMENSEYMHFSYYAFILSAIPIIASLLMNMIELFVKSGRLRERVL